MKGPIKKLVSDDLDLKMQISEKKKRLCGLQTCFHIIKFVQLLTGKKKKSLQESLNSWLHLKA